jgi:hypothetical protein
MKSLIISIILISISFAGVYAGDANLSPSAAALISPGENPAADEGQRILVKFDLPGAIYGKAVHEAYITFTFNFSESGYDTPLEFNVFPLTASWNPETVTWNSWTNPGGDMDSTKINSFAFEPGSSQNFYIDVTEQIQAMAEEELTNHGFILIPEDAIGNAYRSIDPENFNISNLLHLELLYR